MSAENGSKCGARMARLEHEASAYFTAASPEDRWTVRCVAEAPSTMDAARELAGEIECGSFGAVLALRQTEGRGRQGRAWVSPEGGFFATYIFSAPQSTAALAGFSLTAGVAVRSELRALGADVWLKWPNDILSQQGEKLGGILVDASSDGTRTVLFTGIGINLTAAPAIAGRLGTVTSVEELGGAAPEPHRLLGPLGVALAAAWRRMSGTGFAPFRAEWMRGALFVGEKLSVDCGNEIVSGLFREVDESGRLVLETPSGLRQIITGHVVAAA